MFFLFSFEVTALSWGNKGVSMLSLRPFHYPISCNTYIQYVIDSRGFSLSLEKQ